MRCKEIVPYQKRTVIAEHINLSVGSACHKVLCFANNVIIAHMAAFCRLRT